MENKKNLRLTRQTPAIARDSKEENETGAAALEAVTHRDGAAAQPVSSRCGTGTGASRAGERGLPLPSHGRLDWRSAQPEAPGWAGTEGRAGCQPGPRTVGSCWGAMGLSVKLGLWGPSLCGGLGVMWGPSHAATARHVCSAEPGAAGPAPSVRSPV